MRPKSVGDGFYAKTRDHKTIRDIRLNENPEILKGHDRKNFQGKIDSADKFWGSRFDDDHGAFRKARHANEPFERYEATPVRVSSEGERMQLVQPALLSRTIARLHERRPEEWTVSRLAAFFGKTRQEVKRFVFDGEVEARLRAEKHPLAEEMNDDLQGHVEAVFNTGGQGYHPTRCYVAEVFDTRTGRFGYTEKLRLFGATDEETLKLDLGSRVPRLAKREVPLDGPGSGKIINEKKVKRVEAPMIITDISKKKRLSPFSMKLPTSVLQTDGRLRHTTILEYKKVRGREIPNMSERKFSPH